MWFLGLSILLAYEQTSGCRSQVTRCSGCRLDSQVTRCCEVGQARLPLWSGAEERSLQACLTSLLPFCGTVPSLLHTGRQTKAQEAQLRLWKAAVQQLCKGPARSKNTTQPARRTRRPLVGRDYPTPQCCILGATWGAPASLRGVTFPGGLACCSRTAFQLPFLPDACSR